jgi:5-methylcytosine-specific restriction enzyme subunit McrC
MNTASHISVFEHESLKTGEKLSLNQLQVLQKHYGLKGVPYYSLIHNGIKFNEFVGVLRVGNLTIEVLPKTQKKNSDIDTWRDVLIGMLNAVGMFDTKAPSSSALKLKPNSILDLYFELFVNEVEYLFRRGLIKKYNIREGNKNALKGRLLFNKHIETNLIHKERFYVSYTNYDKDHLLHQILFTALNLLSNINTNPILQSRIKKLILDFPEVEKLKVNSSTFKKIVLNRKSIFYSNAIEISKLILLNYHPDLERGRQDVLALMFNMNDLWEKFVLTSIKRKKLDNVVVKGQASMNFWKSYSGRKSRIKPDIVIKKEDETIVLDTKWKNLNGKNPLPDDLRQMYVYSNYFGAKKVALIYPDSTNNIKNGIYYDREGYTSKNECAIIGLAINKKIRQWQEEIYNEIDGWIQN